MHELSIAKELSDIIMEVALKENLSKVIKVNICFGELVQIVPDIFETAFSVIVEDTIIREAELEIEILPVKLRCRNCNNECQVKDKYFFLCDNCNSFDIDIIEGKEIYLRSIEGE
jgi:hydrogenase nickel incorporation protein HypA/HybF